jgi:signal transduction histidine kinase
MDIKEIHDTAIAEVFDPEEGPALVAAHRFLLEVLFAYGAAYSARSDMLLTAAAEKARAEGAASAEEERLALLAGVCHELSNPLTVVKVNVASIRRFLEERASWPEELNQRESDVTFAVERMMSLRDELLAASQNERPELEIVPLPLVHPIRRVMRWAQVLASDKSIELSDDLPADLPYVMADHGALQSILTNLLSNAIRYTPRGGSVTVKAREEGDEVVVAVSDTGIGISEEDQLRIYERFYRAEEGKKAVVFGVGLGLAITRDLVTSMAGTIDVTSEVGAGSTFRVALPKAPMTNEDEERNGHAD